MYNIIVLSKGKHQVQKERKNKMKNVRLNYGTLIVDCEKAEILMYIGRTSMHELWTHTVYSPKGGVTFNQEEVKSFIPMFDAKIIKKEELLTNRFTLYSELSEDSRNRYESVLKEQIIQLNELVSKYLKSLDILKNEVTVDGEDIILVGGEE